MMKPPNPQTKSESDTQLGCALFVGMGLFMLAFLIRDLVAGDTSAVDPDLRRSGFPVRHVEFERQFPSGFWTEGEHAYTLKVICPGLEENLERTHSFTVSTAAQRSPGHVYLRLAGVLAPRSGDDEVVTEFAPAEASSALVILELKPDEHVEYCHATISWDHRPARELMRTHLYTIDVGDGW